MSDSVKAVNIPKKFSNSEPIKLKSSEQLNDVTSVYHYMSEGITKEEYENASDEQKKLISVFINTLPRAQKEDLSSKLGKEDIFLKNGEIAKVQDNIKNEYYF